ncbi:tetratricopeptide repeat protein [Peptoniphilus sp. oral taxon 386 str. F0131]|nr:tetratricopeptide repeat protein [Peptoniphilus sp. oral taxon 386 str. F0131]
MTVYLNFNEKYNNYIIIANDFVSKDDLKSALNAYNKALEFATTPDKKIDVLFEISDIYLIFEEYLSAKICFEKIIEIDSTRSGAYYGVALTNDFLNGSVEESIKYYKFAIEYDDNYDRAYYYLGHCYDKTGDKNAALRCFKKCIDIDSEDYISYNDIGCIYEEQKCYDMAKHYFECSLKINPNYFRALYNMGVVYKALGDNNVALEYYFKAKNEEKNPYIYLNISAIYIELKDFNRAIEILNEGIEYNPESVNLFYNRACSKARLGDKEGALLDLKRAVNINKEAYNWAVNDLDLTEVIKEM